MCPVCSRTRSPKAAFRTQACRQRREVRASLPESGWNGKGQHILACKHVLLWSSHFQPLLKSQSQKSVTVFCAEFHRMKTDFAPWRKPHSCFASTLDLHVYFCPLTTGSSGRKLPKFRRTPPTRPTPGPTRTATTFLPPSPLLPSAPPAEQSKHWVSPSSGCSPALITHCSPVVVSVR